MQVTLPVRAFAAVAAAMAVKDIRYYLNGALIEVNGTTAHVVATDGHRLHVMRVPDATEAPATEAPATERQQVILPDTLVKQIIKSVTKKAQTLNVTIEWDDSGNNDAREPTDRGETIIRVKLPLGDIILSKAVDGQYPDWRRVVPTTVTGEWAPINPRYVLDAMESANIAAQISKADCWAAAVATNGFAGALLQVPSAGFFAVLMPMRDEYPSKTLDPELLS